MHRHRPVHRPTLPLSKRVRARLVDPLLQPLRQQPQRLHVVLAHGHRHGGVPGVRVAYVLHADVRVLEELLQDVSAAVPHRPPRPGLLPELLHLGVSCNSIFNVHPRHQDQLHERSAHRGGTPLSIDEQGEVPEITAVLHQDLQHGLVFARRLRTLRWRRPAAPPPRARRAHHMGKLHRHIRGQNTGQLRGRPPPARGQPTHRQQ
mmetsp:Transcript_86101/g.230511  ORF Transcript_86101/g.230511 Transcript_86101/m.230511 type:complete len:205 (+) Transcript_86101:349-963(+)